MQVRAQSADTRRIAGLESLGYDRAGPAGVGFRFALDGMLPAPETPPGYRVRDSVGIDPALRAAAHRAAWNHLDHLGIAASSRFSTEAYLSLAALPIYDPRLDILVEAPDGSLVANCICWPDEASGVGVFEPVGVALAHRGRRLASAVMREALHRLQACGHREARVGTAHFNHAAIAAYRAAGFEPADSSFWWAKVLD
jgi:ribosomal protein S18 acetylase RimI-like enzyme